MPFGLFNLNVRMSFQLHLSSNRCDFNHLPISAPLAFLIDNKRHNLLEQELDFSLHPLFAPPDYADIGKQKDIQAVFDLHKETNQLDLFWENLAQQLALAANLESYREILTAWIKHLDQDASTQQLTNTLLQTSLAPYYQYVIQQKMAEFTPPRNFEEVGFCQFCPEEGRYCLEEGDCLHSPRHSILTYVYNVPQLLEELRGWLVYVEEQAAIGATKIGYVVLLVE